MIWPSEMLERAKQMWDQGYSGGRIGAEVGMTRNAVLGMANRRQWGRRGPDSPLKGMSRRQHRARPKAEKRERVRRKPQVNGNMLWLLKTPKYVKPAPVEPSRKTACTMMGLTSRSCRFPVGDATGRDQLFCAADKEFEQSYCDFHRLRAYGIGTPSERRALEAVA